MITCTYTDQIDGPASAVWEYIAWENLDRMLGGPMFSSVSYQEREPVKGAQRTIMLTDGSSIAEELVKSDAQAMHLMYKITDPGNAPIQNYQGEVRITPVSDNRCQVAFSGMQAAMVSYISSDLEGRGK